MAAHHLGEIHTYEQPHGWDKDTDGWGSLPRDAAWHHPRASQTCLCMVRATPGISQRPRAVGNLYARGSHSAQWGSCLQLDLSHDPLPDVKEWYCESGVSSPLQTSMQQAACSPHGAPTPLQAPSRALRTPQLLVLQTCTALTAGEQLSAARQKHDVLFVYPPHWLKNTGEF